MNYIDLLRLRKKTIKMFDNKFDMKNPTNLKYKNETLKLRLVFQYNKIQEVRNEIMFANEEQLKLIQQDIKEVA